MIRYNRLNQRCLFGSRLYCRMALGGESVSCSVDPKFKFIVVVATSRAHGNKIPVALLNHFEKQIVNRDAQNILIQNLVKY